MQMAIDSNVPQRQWWKFWAPGLGLANPPHPVTPPNLSGARDVRVVRGSDRRVAERGPDRRIGEMRDANEHLVVAAVHAQTVAEEAQKVSQLKDEYLAAVSHEIRTPLGAVLGWVRVLEAKQLPPEQMEHAVAAIGRNASALAHLINDLLDMSRVLNGKMRLALGPVVLTSVAQAALDTVHSLAAAKRVQLEFTIAGCQPVTGDAVRLQQVIWNLLSNAIKFTPDGGRVALFIEAVGDHMEIRVVDTGHGISPAFLPHVFEPFRQGDEATTERHTGLGLGLGIVRNLVTLHGGTVQAASPGLGQGSTFTVRLPIDKP